MSRRTIHRITVLILLIGLGSALAIYLTADAVLPDPLGYDPLRDKKYLRELQLYGGKANVVSAEFVQWFHDLWHGQSLAFTVAAITLVVAWIFHFVATLPPADDHDEPGKPAGPNPSA